MSKIFLNDLDNLQNESTAVSTVNNNNTAMETAIENTLSRNGVTPNQMGAVLDMNSNQIINLPPPASATSPLRLADMNAYAFTSGLITPGAVGQVLTGQGISSTPTFSSSPSLLGPGSTTALGGIVGNRLNIFDGSAGSPVSSKYQPTIFVSRQESIPSDATDDGSNGPAIYAYATTTGTGGIGGFGQQVVAVGGRGTALVGSNTDAVGIYGVGVNQGAPPAAIGAGRSAFGGFFLAQNDVEGGNSISVETATINNTGHDGSTAVGHMNAVNSYYISGPRQTPVTNAVWSAGSGGRITFTPQNDLTTHASAGESITVTGITPSGYNGTYTIISVSPTTIVVAKVSNPGTYTSGGTIASRSDLRGGAAYTIFSQNAGVADWDSGILFDQGISQNCIFDRSHSVEILTSTGVHTSGINLSSASFSSAAFSSPGFNIDGTGNITGKTLVSAVSPTSAVNAQFLGSQLTIANGSNGALFLQRGLVIATESSVNADSALYLVSGGTAVMVSSTGSGWVASTLTPAAGHYSIAFDGTSKYRIYNNRGGSSIFIVAQLANT